MFSEQLTFLKDSKRHQINPQHKQRWQEKGSITQADLQYQICGAFMKHTGQKLSAQQSQLMQQSRRFLQSYASNHKKERDSLQTVDTFLQLSEDPSLSIEEEKCLGINRKNSSNFASRKNILLLVEQLSEIQQRCSYSCYNFFNTLVAEYKKMQNKIKSFQTKESFLNKREEFGQRFHQENVILKKRLEHQQQKIGHLQAQIQLLKQKNRSINSSISEKINNINVNNKYVEINNKVYKDIKIYIQQKQTVLKTQYQRISSTETAVLRSIQDAFKGESCMKCCEILRKLKESIIKYKKYLEGQSQQFEKLYDKYKKTMYSIKSRSAI